MAKRRQYVVNGAQVKRVAAYGERQRHQHHQWPVDSGSGVAAAHVAYGSMALHEIAYAAKKKRKRHSVAAHGGDGARKRIGMAAAA